MFLKSSVFLFLLSLCWSPASAEITLEKSFWSGWKYSVDGETFTKVGISGSSLYSAMEGNTDAQLHMSKYKTAKISSTATAIPAGLLLGLSLGGWVANDEWQDSYTAMVVFGGALMVVGIIFESSATRNLKKAVSLFNGEDQSLSLGFDLAPRAMNTQTTAAIGLSYSF